MRFAIIGAQKSASTSLQKALAQHPEVYMPRGETPTFEAAYYSPSAVAELERTCATESGGRTIGIRRPDYLALPEAPGNIARHYPDARFVAVLRNPADRALSAYFHYMRFGLITPEPPEDGLRRLLDEYPTVADPKPRRFEVLTYGLYGRALATWHAHFDPEQILVEKQERLLADPPAVLDEIRRHIGLSEPLQATLERTYEGVYHPTRLAVWKRMHPFLYKETTNERLVARSRVVSGMFSVVDSQILSRLLPGDRPKLSASLRSELAAFYDEDLQDLVRLRGIDTSGWRNG